MPIINRKRLYLYNLYGDFVGSANHFDGFNFEYDYGTRRVLSPPQCFIGTTMNLYQCLQVHCCLESEAQSVLPFLDI